MPHPFQHPAQRRCPNSPCKQAQTQPLQSSSAALTTHNLSSNDIFSRWKHQPRKGMLSGSASAGGELILGRRESALFFKSPLSERQQAASSDFLKTLLADFRRPRSQPPTKPQTRQHPLPRRPSAQKRRHPTSVSPLRNRILIPYIYFRKNLRPLRRFPIKQQPEQNHHRLIPLYPGILPD